MSNHEDDDNDNDNGNVKKKTIGFMSKPTAARVSRFLVHFFDVHRTTTT